MNPFTPETTLVLRNPVSGRPSGRRRAVRLATELASRGFRVEVTAGPGHAAELAAAAGRRGVGSFVCMGGDGTLFEALGGLPADAALAVFPTGTVNLFAMGLGIPATEAGWLALLEARTTRQAYFGLCGDRPFASVASVGFDAGVVARVHRGLKRRVQEGAYAWQAVRDLPGYRVPGYRVRLDGETWNGPLVGVLVCKGPYYAMRRPLLPEVSHEHDRLEAVLLTGHRRGDLLRYAWGIVSGRLRAQPGAVRRSVREIVVETDPAAHVQLDGDAHGSTPVRFACEPRPRTILAPASR